MKTLLNKILSGSVLLLMMAILPSCHDVEYPEHSNLSALGSIKISVKVPQIDPATVVYKDIDGVIDDASHTVTFDVPYNMSTVIDDVTDLSQTFLVASAPVGSVINPGLGGLKDMTNPMDIVVTAADGTKTPYTMTANLKKSSAASITAFSFKIGENTFTGIPVESTHTVTYLVATPDLTDLIAANKAVGTFEVSPRATIISPDITQPIDFSKDVAVKVQAQDGTIQEWKIVQAAPEILDYGFGYTKKKWQLTADEMGFGSSLDFRSIAVTKNYLVVQDRYMEHRLYNKDTGAFVGKTPMPSDLNDSNKAAGMYIVADAAGHLVAGSFSSWTTGSKFAVYCYANGEQSHPVRILDVAGLGDCGRKFAVTGDLTSGTAFLYATIGKGNAVYRFEFKDGKLVEQKKITITSPNSAFTYTCTPVPIENSALSKFILIDQQATGLGCVSLHDADGGMISKMTDGAKCMSGGLTADGKCFTFNNATYLMYIDQSGDNVKGRIRIYDITKLDNFAMGASDPRFLSEFLKFSSPDIVTSVGNGNGTGEVAYDLSADGETMNVYLMLTGGGVMKYELTKIKLAQ